MSTVETRNLLYQIFIKIEDLYRLALRQLRILIQNSTYSTVSPQEILCLMRIMQDYEAEQELIFSTLMNKGKYAINSLRFQLNSLSRKRMVHINSIISKKSSINISREGIDCLSSLKFNSQCTEDMWKIILEVQELKDNIKT